MNEYTRATVLRIRSRYLNDMQQLLGRLVGNDELLPIEETKRFRLGKFSRCPKTVAEFPAGFVASAMFLELIAVLKSVNPVAVSIWIRDTIGIGTIVVSDLHEINFPNSFNVTGQLAAFITIDGKDRMLIENDLEEKTETIELQGIHWIALIDFLTEAGGTIIPGYDLNATRQ
jgi:hypothetical protein